jgi:hypothetical protein
MSPNRGLQRAKEGTTTAKIVAEIAEREGVEPLELEPPSERIDPAALESLLTNPSGANPGTASAWSSPTSDTG